MSRLRTVVAATAGQLSITVVSGHFVLYCTSTVYSTVLPIFVVLNVKHELYSYCSLLISRRSSEIGYALHTYARSLEAHHDSHAATE